MPTARQETDRLISRLLLCVALRWFPAVCIFSTAAGAEAQEAKPAANAYRYWTTNWSLKDVDVGRLVDRLSGIGIELPVAVQGDVSVDFRVSVPLNGLSDAEAYRLDGRFSAKRLRIERLQLSDFLAHVDYRDGVLRLSELDTAWREVNRQPVNPSPNVPAAGSIRGIASVGLVPRGDVEANVEIRDAAVGPLADLLRHLGILSSDTAVLGEVNGSARLRCHVDDLQSPGRWDLTARLQSPGIQFGRLAAVRFDTGAVRIEDAKLRIAESEIAYVDKEQIRCTAAVEMLLDKPRRFETHLVGNDLPTQEIASLFLAEGESPGSPVQGKVDLNVRGRGDIDGGRWNVVGRVASPAMQVMGFDLGLLEHEIQTDQTSFRLAPMGEAVGGDGDPSSLHSRGIKLGSVTADYRFTPDAFQLKQLQANVFGGRVRAEASIPRSGVRQQSSIDLSWQKIASDFALPRLGISTRGSAESSGKIVWTFPAGQWDAPLSHRGVAEISLSKVKLAEVGIGNINVKVEADGETLDADGDGKLFGGEVKFRTVADIDTGTSWIDVLRDAWRTQVQFDSVQLSSAAYLVRPEVVGRMRGELSGSLAVSHRADATVHGDDTFSFASGDTKIDSRFRSRTSPEGSTRWAGNILLRGLLIQGRPVTPQLQAQLRGDETRVIVDRIAGRYAEGELSATGVWSLGPGQRQLSMRATSVNVPLALLPAWPDADDWFRGHASLQATVTGNETVAARGSLQWHEGDVVGVAIDGGHGAFHGRFHTRTSRWQADFERLHLQLGGGTVDSALHLSSAGRGRGFDMTSSSRARRVDFARLLKTDASAFSLANSRASGDLKLGGKAIRGVDDLTGRFNVALDGTDARAVPGLLKTQAYLGAASLASVRFNEGRMRGVIGAGAVSLREFSLISNKLRVFADGTVRLADGRMDVAAVLNTGDFQAQNFLLRQVANVASGGITVPLDLIVEVNQILSDRTLIVDLTGAAANPRVRLNTVRTLRENAVNFFLRQARRSVTAAVIDVTYD